ncbi:NTF2 protein [Salix suchowensis]|nr:NTF2 protein [Salix suchowensis]
MLDACGQLCMVMSLEFLLHHSSHDKPCIIVAYKGVLSTALEKLKYSESLRCLLTILPLALLPQMPIQPRLISNAVPSVVKPTTLLILVDDDSIGSGWCEQVPIHASSDKIEWHLSLLQFSQEGYNVLHVKYPSVEEDGYDLRQALLKADEEVSKLGCDWALITYGLSAVDARDCNSPFCPRGTLKGLYPLLPNTTSAKPFLLKKKSGGYIPSVFHIPASQELLHAALVPHTQAEQPNNGRSHPVISLFTYPLVPEKCPFPLMLNAPSRAARETVCPHIRSATTLSLTRTLTLLRRCIGPYFDLESVWEEHAHYVSEPYVNHISTLTGGMGRQDLLRFYKTNVPPNREETHRDVDHSSRHRDDHRFAYRTELTVTPAFCPAYHPPVTWKMLPPCTTSFGVAR